MANISQLPNDLYKLFEVIREDLAQEVGKTVRDRAKLSLDEPKSGVLNKNTGKPRSEWGEPPASDTGETKRNTFYRTKKVGGKTTVIDIINNTKYAGYMEASNYLNRPYLQNAVSDVMDNPIIVEDLIVKAVNKHYGIFIK